MTKWDAMTLDEIVTLITTDPTSRASYARYVNAKPASRLVDLVDEDERTLIDAETRAATWRRKSAPTMAAVTS